jgi:tellurite resistance protein TerC
MIPELWLWVGFGVVVLVMLALDLGVFHRKSHEVGVKEALLWTGAWVALALLFNAGVWYWLGGQRGLEFLTGYVIELSLSVDNLFVFMLVFAYFGVPARFQHKVLFWGIVGALVMRLIFIGAGIALVEKFHAIIYVFGAILVFSGIKMAVAKDREVHPEKNPVLKLFRAIVPVTTDYHDGRFTARVSGRLMATPLLVVLIGIESADLVFAVDSVPAVLAITTEPFIVYTSNVFAMLGLRSMFFALAGIMKLFSYLHYGLSAVLVFVGLKLTLSDVFHVPTIASLAVISGILAVSILASIWRAKQLRPRVQEPAEKPERRLSTADAGMGDRAA